MESGGAAPASSRAKRIHGQAGLRWDRVPFSGGRRGSTLSEVPAANVSKLTASWRPRETHPVPRSVGRWPSHSLLTEWDLG